MRAFAYLSQGQAGWIEKEIPKPTGVDGVIRPLLVAPCTSDVHNVAINCLPPTVSWATRVWGRSSPWGKGSRTSRWGRSWWSPR